MECKGWKLYFLLFLYSQVAVSQSDTSDIFSSIPLFQNDSLINLELRFDILGVKRDTGENPIDHLVSITYLNYYGGKEKIKGQLHARGIFRKRSENCNFPPLLIKISKNNSDLTQFQGIKKVKLVTHCQNNSKYYEISVLREYLAYKLYNLLTPYSFNVKLARIYYIDEYECDTIVKFGFFIEPDLLLAQRVKGKIIEQKNIHPNSTNKELTVLMSFFQYLIGNTDWSIKALHNIILVEAFPGSPPIAIPFDFDFSGFVNAPYALPAEQLPIKTVKERYYNGYCKSYDQYAQVINEFNVKKESIYQLITSFPYLSDRDKHKITKYLDGFFHTINSPKKVNREFVNKCRTE